MKTEAYQKLCCWLLGYPMFACNFFHVSIEKWQYKLHQIFNTDHANQMPGSRN